MSHEATMWAVKVRGISCTEARVLWHLADCHNPIFGCYPKQDYLADACEIDERSVRRSLSSLRDKGLVNWSEQREGKNRKANRYSLGFEAGFRRFEAGESVENEPDNLSASSEASNGQEGTIQPDSDDAFNRTPESSIEPVREPVIEPVTERGSAREVSEDDPKALRKRFQALIVGRHDNPWPDVLSSAPEWAFQQFVKLSPEERLRAEERRDAYLAACPKLQSGEHKGKPRSAALGVYLRDRMFDLVDAIAPQAVRGQAEKRRQEETIPVAPFGPIWAGKRAFALLDGPIDIQLPSNLLELAVETYTAQVNAKESRSLPNDGGSLHARDRASPNREARGRQAAAFRQDGRVQKSGRIRRLRHSHTGEASQGRRKNRDYPGGPALRRRRQRQAARPVLDQRDRRSGHRPNGRGVRAEARQERRRLRLRAKQSLQLRTGVAVPSPAEEADLVGTVFPDPPMVLGCTLLHLVDGCFGFNEVQAQQIG
ncbi:helix-turn-helix domain-containing protein [Rhizobium leguminosarum]|uniref:helix-turn-helix domain-containing protein n=1 Tax=Rhizobium leguminosarum TaxID=384 RepID=UPI0009BE5CCB|nr:helix-turn-helix domain-containing protein [Rhizobium leguminosarum]